MASSSSAPEARYTGRPEQHVLDRLREAVSAADAVDEVSSAKELLRAWFDARQSWLDEYNGKLKDEVQCLTTWPWEGEDGDGLAGEEAEVVDEDAPVEHDQDFPWASDSRANKREMDRHEGRPTLRDLQLQVRSARRRHVAFFCSPNGGAILHFDTRSSALDRSFGEQLAAYEAGVQQPCDKIFLGMAADPLNRNGTPFCWGTPCYKTWAEFEERVLDDVKLGSEFVVDAERKESEGAGRGVAGTYNWLDDDEWVLIITTAVVGKMLLDARSAHEEGNSFRATKLHKDTVVALKKLSRRAVNVAIMELLVGTGMVKAARA